MKNCEKCGHELDPVTGLCPNCDKQKTNRKKFLIPIAIFLVIAIIASGLFAGGVIDLPWKEKISEANAEKMVDLVEEIKRLEENNATKSEIKDYLNTLDWMINVSESEDGGLTCVTEFGITGVWTPKKENVIGSSKSYLNLSDIKNTANTNSDSHFVRSIALLCPYASDDTDFLLDYYSFLGDTMTKYADSSFTVFKDGEVTLDLLKHLDQYDMVWFYSHGALSNVSDSAWAVFDSDPYTMTGEFADSAAKYIILSDDFLTGRTIISISSGRIGVGGNFYEHYYSDKALRNTFFHFASCNSMRTEKLADGLLSRGAVWVEGWTDSVNFSNDYGQFMFAIENLLNHNTIQQSLINADKKMWEENPGIYQEDCKLKGKGNDGYKIESKNQTDIDIEDELEKAFSGTISGKVVSSKDNKAIKGVSVTAYHTDDTEQKEVASASTNDNGGFEFNLPEGSYILDFLKDGYKSHTNEIKIKKGVITILQYDIVLEPDKIIYDVDTDKVYSSDMIQMVGNDVYYCSSDGAPEYMALPTLDFSEVKPEYKKLPINVDNGVQSFIIYGDSIYYIAGYSNSPGGLGKLYKCDVEGNNKKLIAENINNRLFEIRNYVLTYSAGAGYSGKSMIYTYDLNNNSTVGSSDNSSLGVFEFASVFGNMKGQASVEFDGGKYYYEVIKSMGTEPNRIDGKLANVIYYREDIETGKTERVGYYYDQAR